MGRFPGRSSRRQGTWRPARAPDKAVRDAAVVRQDVLDGNVVGGPRPRGASGGGGKVGRDKARVLLHLVDDPRFLRHVELAVRDEVFEIRRQVLPAQVQAADGSGNGAAVNIRHGVRE